MPLNRRLNELEKAQNALKLGFFCIKSCSRSSLYIDNCVSRHRRFELTDNEGSNVISI